MKKLISFFAGVTLLTAGLVTTTITNPNIVSAKKTKQPLVAGTLRLTKTVKVKYIKMENHPWKNHAIKTTTLKKGTIVKAFPKYTEDCYWVVFGGHVKITKNVWPSANLTKHNAVQISKSDVYGHLPKSYTE